jgi:pullulanase/glycogen debranching enzyme
MPFPTRGRRIAGAAVAGLLLAPALGAQPAHASDAPHALADCDAAAPADTLLAAAAPDAGARAYWLDASTVQWPGAPEGARYALHRSARAALRVDVGAPVSGADQRVALTPATAPLPRGVAERFRFVRPGARLALPPSARAQLAGLLRDQVVLVREDAQGRVVEATGVQLPGALDARYASATAATDLGATALAGDARGARTAFALWAPTARRVSVCLYAGARGAATHRRWLRLDPATGIWRDTVAGVGHGRPYRFVVDVFVAGAGVVRNRVTDPYSLGLTANSARSVVLDLRHPSTRPAGWDRAARPAALAAPTDLTVYELHVRDFSAGDTTVRAPWRGKFLAFTEAGSAGMRHMRALAAAGITDVHLLPIYDLASVPEVGCLVPAIPRAAPDAEAQQAAVSAVRERDCFNWGYDPYHYTAPEGSYATAPDDAAARARELRAMVMALHAAGLRVGMDVVYNHTFAAGQDPRSVLDRVVPGYYHRLDSDGRIARSTCCENTATEHAMMAKLMIESAAVWARHYRLDSFRFDLMGHQPRAAMERLQAAVDAAAGRRVPILGEGWDFGEVAGGARFVQASQRSLPGSGIATFSDRARDALRGGGCCDGGAALVDRRGLLSGLADAPHAPDSARQRHAELLRAADLARVGLAGTLRAYEMTGADGARRPLAAFDYAGQPAGYAAQPGEVVNYVENHDNLTLFDLLALRLPRDLPREQRARAQVLGVAFTAFSQGVAYLHAGVELLRSKSLDRDSFDSGDWFNRLDWTFSDNGFGGGVPPRHRNAADWPWMKPALADARIPPTAAEIRWARGASLDLLRIRRSSTLFRLRSADDVRRRLHFRNVGPAQDPAVLVGHLDGAGYAGAAFREVLYLVNVAGAPREVTLPEEVGKAYVLHPVHRAADAADRTAREARVDAASGRFTIPGRTAVVFVIEGP